MILNEFDKTKESTFDPFEVINVINDFPKIGITFFSKKLMDRFVEKFNPIEIAKTSSANGNTPIYKINYKGKDVAVYMSRVGAPACSIDYEEILAMGLKKLIMFGTCGVLDKNIQDLSVIIPTTAVRDEGTSYHYMPASDEVSVNEKYIEEFKEILDIHNYSYTEGKVWTTDAIYRETRNKVLERKKAGCICVDMECSAMSAVSKFRRKDFFQFFYAADNLDDAKWDARSLGDDDKLSEKEKIILLALELTIKM